MCFCMRYRGKEGRVCSRQKLIKTARLIVKESEIITTMAREVAGACTDKRMKNVRT